MAYPNFGENQEYYSPVSEENTSYHNRVKAHILSLQNTLDKYKQTLDFTREGVERANHRLNTAIELLAAILHNNNGNLSPVVLSDIVEGLRLIYKDLDKLTPPFETGDPASPAKSITEIDRENKW